MHCHFLFNIKFGASQLYLGRGGGKYNCEALGRALCEAVQGEGGGATLTPRGVETSERRPGEEGSNSLLSGFLTCGTRAEFQLSGTILMYM